eukprot:361500-Chlamydomonas_euryale.AAC.7
MPAASSASGPATAPASALSRRPTASPASAPATAPAVAGPASARTRVWPRWSQRRMATRCRAFARISKVGHAAFVRIPGWACHVTSTPPWKRHCVLAMQSQAACCCEPRRALQHNPGGALL